MTIVTIVEYQQSSSIRWCYTKNAGSSWLLRTQSAAVYWASIENGGVLENRQELTVDHANNISGISLNFAAHDRPIYRWQNQDTEGDDPDKTIQIGLQDNAPIPDDPDKTIQIGMTSAPELNDPDKTIEIGLTTAPEATVITKTIEIGLTSAPQDGTIGPIFENWIAAFFQQLYRYGKSNKWSNKWNGKWSNRF